MKHWIIVAQACSECGSEQAVLMIRRAPTEQDEKAIRKALGGMACIITHTYETALEEIVTYKSPWA